MGIIISSFPGCGKSYLMNTHGDKAKMLDAFTPELVGDSGDGGYDYNVWVDKIMNVVDEYDIVFVPVAEKMLETLNKREIDYDIFYPSKERRGEFLENQVKKHSPMNEIRELDNNFDKWIEEIDDDDSENCHKHKMNEKGLFIGNTQVIMEFMAFLKNNKKENNVSDDTSR